MADCIHQSVDDCCYEVPAGGLGSVEDTEEVTRLKLSEGVGGTADERRYFGKFYTSNGISNEAAYVYLTTGVACLSSSDGSRLSMVGELGETHREPTERSDGLTRRANGGVPDAHRGGPADCARGKSQ